MSKKFFSLINGAGIHIAPKTKVIPQAEIETLLEAKGVLDAVKIDAEKYRVEVAKECELLKEQAQREGFEEGYKKWIQQMAELENELERVRSELQEVLIPVALKAAKKIVGREIELSQNTIVDIVSNCLKSVSTHKRVTVYVNRKDLEAMEKNRPRLKELFEGLEVLSLRERKDVAQGGCIIETEGGIINAQLENQWRALENALGVILKKNEPVQKGH